MSASGKSSNRHSEASRARHTGSGHGIYAAEGIRDYQREQGRRAAAQCAVPTPIKPVTLATRARPTQPVPLSLIGVGITTIYATAAVIGLSRKIREIRR